MAATVVIGVANRYGQRSAVEALRVAAAVAMGVACSCRRRLKVQALRVAAAVTGLAVLECCCGRVQGVDFDSGGGGVYKGSVLRCISLGCGV